MGFWRNLARGFGYITLDPAPRLHGMREEAEAKWRGQQRRPLPPLPDSAYPPDAVSLDLSGIPADTEED